MAAHDVMNDCLGTPLMIFCCERLQGGRRACVAFHPRPGDDGPGGGFSCFQHLFCDLFAKSLP